MFASFSSPNEAHVALSIRIPSVCERIDIEYVDCAATWTEFNGLFCNRHMNVLTHNGSRSLNYGIRFLQADRLHPGKKLQHMKFSFLLSVLTSAALMKRSKLTRNCSRWSVASITTS